MTELAQTRAHSTIRSYRVRHLHVLYGLGNPLHGTLKLELVLRGIHRVQPKKKVARLPVTPAILAKIKQGLDQDPGFESTMLWAACCMGFFWFSALWGFMLQDAARFDTTVHLTVPDIAVDNPTNPSICRSITIKKSKTDQFCNGTTIYLGKTSQNICPVAAVLQYLAV